MSSEPPKNSELAIISEYFDTLKARRSQLAKELSIIFHYKPY